MVNTKEWVGLGIKRQEASLGGFLKNLMLNETTSAGQRD